MSLLNRLFLRINNERNSKIYLYQKEDNTILGPNITINFKIIHIMTSYERRNICPKLQRLTAEQYKRLQIDNNKLLNYKNISQYKLNCTVVCSLL
jgi:hypothetical protein